MLAGMAAFPLLLLAVLTGWDGWPFATNGAVSPSRFDLPNGSAHGIAHAFGLGKRESSPPSLPKRSALKLPESQLLRPFSQNATLDIY
jgi:hypothetical protein